MIDSARVPTHENAGPSATWGPAVNLKSANGRFVPRRRAFFKASAVISNEELDHVCRSWTV
jgi:hypothetical protein